jgi:alkylhydroperoxidase/carboxymuconolactone decarboxylase family protein YurZ
MKKNESSNFNTHDAENALMNEELKIIEKMQQENGTISKAIKLMSKRSGTVNAFVSYRNIILNNGPLSNKERSLIMLATTVALKSESCISVQSLKAKNAGANEDEIIQTMLIVGLVSGNSPLNVAYSSYYEDDKG